MRVNPSREFFKCALPKIQGIFEGIQGTWWKDGIITKKEEARSSETKNFNLRSETKNKEISLKVVVKSAKKRMKLGRKAKNVKMNYKV
jgi:hypothetical protein